MSFTLSDRHLVWQVGCHRLYTIPMLIDHLLMLGALFVAGFTLGFVMTFIIISAGKKKI